MGWMSTRLEQAFAEASKLPDSDQDLFAEFLLAELLDEKEWQSKFAESQDALARLARESREDNAAGRTRPIEDLFR